MRKERLKICVVTGSRAEYGLFYPLLLAIQKEAAFQLQLVVTGMHLSPEFGLTYKQIESDGFTINEKVEMLLSGDTDAAIIKSTGLGLIGYADAFNRLQPDWVILLGDRFETFAAATAAHLAKIPIAHLHGGEVTEGATDDAFRHAITKMAFLHFTSAEIYRRRVIQLGEQPERVFNVGAIGLDNIRILPFLSKPELEKDLGISNINNAILVTFHPVTLEKNSAESQMKELLQAFDQLPEFFVIFTLPNADANGRIIIKLINDYVKQNAGRSKAYTSLGQLRYLSLLKYVKAVVGNSSSGIIEVPAFKIPTINIGNRQGGRMRANSIVDVKPDTNSILKGIEVALSKSFLANCKKTANPYGNGKAAINIVKQIKKTGRLNNLQKKFFDFDYAKLESQINISK